MPGIVGIIAESFAPEMRAQLEKMRRYLLHEAAYHTGSFVSERNGVGFAWAHHAGSFSDCAPLWNESKDACLIFAGEDFSGGGAGQSGRNGGANRGAEYLMERYEEQGLECLKSLNGWFSGVIFDLRQNETILFNDRFGLQRIYYHAEGGVFYFASEAKCLLSILPSLRQLDAVGFAELCAVGCAMQNRTIFAGLNVLPPASCWRFAQGKTVAQTTYFLATQWEVQEPLSAEEFYLQLQETFSRVLPKYFQGDRAIGMSLTGGLDGRMVMAWAKQPRGSLPCYTFGGPYRDCTDVTVARQVASAAGQSHQTITVGAGFHRDFPQLAERSTYLSDGTMDVTGAVELFTNAIAREIAPVRMTGNYGSEILRESVAFRPRRLNRQLFADDPLRLSETAATTYESERRCNLHSFIAFKQVPWHHTSRLSVEQTQLTMRSPFLDNELVALMYRAPAELSRSAGPALRLIADGNATMSRIPTDRGLLLRPTPILSKMVNHYHEFTFKAEYAYDYGMPQTVAKVDHFLRHLRLERLFLGRHKFYHFRVWYRTALASFIKSVLLDPRTLSRTIFRKGALEKIVRDHLSGKANYTTEIHQALGYELIERQLIERNWSADEP